MPTAVTPRVETEALPSATTLTPTVVMPLQETVVLLPVVRIYLLRCIIFC
jgi:hypothetical protein